MIKPPYLIGVLSGIIVACVTLGSRINELTKPTPGLTGQESRLHLQDRSSNPSSDSSGRKRNLRPDPTRNVVVNYAFLEQGLQVSLPDLYGSYIESLGLSSYESRYFESLLVERLIVQQQFGLELITGDAEEISVSTRTVERRINENNLKIHRFLNHPDDYADFIIYEKQLPERRSLRAIRPFLTQLTRESEEQLIELLYQCRLNTEGEQPIWANVIPIKNVELQLENWQRSDESLARDLPSILSGDLARDFLKHWKIARQIQRDQSDPSIHRCIGKDEAR